MKPVPRLCAAYPPIRARVREEIEDFQVEEVLAYEAVGEGTHSFLLVEKKGLTTFEAVRRLSRALGRRDRDFGYAGLKDKHARTRQWISIEHLEEDRLEGLDLPGMEILELRKHRNKIKLGHLRGNRFVLRLRGVGEGDEARARDILSLLERRGLPNAFGLQRFGRGSATPRLGTLLLEERWEDFLRVWAGSSVGLGEAEVEGLGPDELLTHCEGKDRFVFQALDRWKKRDAQAAVRSCQRRFLSLCTAALQSQVFNRVLAARLETLDRIQEGEVAMLHRNGAVFAVEDPATEQPRCDAFEISPTGPLPGPLCPEAQGPTGALEAEILAASHISPELFQSQGPYAQRGSRRSLRVPLRDASVQTLPGKDSEQDIELSFFLPSGSYATRVFFELLGSETGDP